MQERLSPEESLRIIDQAMAQTRYNLGENRFAFLFWGYFILALSLLHFALLNMNVENHWMGWLAAPLGYIVVMLYYRNRSKQEAVSHGVGDVFAWLWGILGINVLLIGFVGHSLIGPSFIALIILLISLGTLASGAILRFRPLIIGSIITNIIALCAIVFIPFEYHLLLSALAALLCDIIPGHMLKDGA